MIEILTLSIGIGLVMSLLYSEFFGIAPGGMVVPGYIALFLTHPGDVILTLAAGFVAYLLLQLLSSVTIIYGRRRTVVMILIGYIIGMTFRYLMPDMHIFGEEAAVIGFIIPGLIGIWFDRQGVVETVSTLLIVSVMVRLVLVMVIGEELKI